MADESLDCCAKPAPVTREMWEAEQLRKYYHRRGKPMPFGALLGAARPPEEPAPAAPPPAPAAATIPAADGHRHGLG